MDKFASEPKKTGIYRINDPLKGFQIKVCIKRTAQGPIGPAFKEATANGEELQEVELQALQGSKDETEEYVFHWNEKVFSEREWNLYSDERLCISYLDQQYHQQVNEEQRRKTKRLFSYVDADIIEGKFNWDECIVSGMPSESSILVEHMKGLTLHHHVQGMQQSRSELSSVPSRNIVQDSSTRQKHVLPKYQKMYIMADLKPSEESNPKNVTTDEAVLCEITLDSNGVLMVNPDFTTSNQNPYCIRNSQNELFQYVIWNASQPINSEDVENERNIWKKMALYNDEVLKKCVGTNFMLPNENEMKVFVSGEIVSAQKFEYDGLYVSYIWDVPEGWYVPSACNLSGTTQRCNTKVEHEDEIAYFGFPLEMEFTFVKANNNFADGIPAWPKLYFEVYSVDFWGSSRIEGYTYVMLPSTPGSHQLTLLCWRSQESTHVDKLRRYFIGGSPELEDLTYLGAPLQSNRVSKFGFQSQSTGEIVIRLNILLQSLQFIHLGRKKKRQAAKGGDWLRQSPQDSAVAGVLAAYHRTRQKMLQTRRELEVELSRP